MASDVFRKKAAVLPPNDEDDPVCLLTSQALPVVTVGLFHEPLPLITLCTLGTVALVLPYYITHTHGFVQVQVDPMNSAS
jgi:hypothetical protein